MRPTRSRTRPLADFINVCLGPSLASQGFAAADVITAWPEIVGQRLAEFTQPLKIEWKKRRFPSDPDQRPEPATLVVRVEGAFALELQHLAPIVVERVNAHYGWRCIGRLALRQAPVRRAKRERPQSLPLSAADRERIALAAEPIEEDRLRAALGRLGEAVLGSARAEPATKP